MPLPGRVPTLHPHDGATYFARSANNWCRGVVAPQLGEWVQWAIRYTVPEDSPLISQELGFMVKKPANLDAMGQSSFDGPLSIAFTPATPAPPSQYLGDLTVRYLVETGTATPGEDYLPLSGSITIPDGEASAAITITTIADLLVEGDESIALSIIPQTGYIVGPAWRATQTIIDQGTPPETRACNWTLY